MGFMFVLLGIDVLIAVRFRVFCGLFLSLCPYQRHMSMVFVVDSMRGQFFL